MKKYLPKYWYLLALPIVAMYFGSAMNELALVVNGNQMPVFLPASMWEICSDPIRAFGQAGDTIHSCMTHATHLKFLCDWIVLGNPNPDMIMSPGDVFIFLGYYLQMPAMFAWFALVWRNHIAKEA